MEAKGEKQVSLAKALGITPSAISHWFRGVGGPRREEMIKLAKYYGLTLDQLFMDDVSLPAVLEIRLPIAKAPDSRKKSPADTRKTLRKTRKK